LSEHLLELILAESQNLHSRCKYSMSDSYLNSLILNKL
jgi:hypothetical protein